jgi:anaerobic magnesium-protoporphyrin IX monomethyl ester cyclase
MKERVVYLVNASRKTITLQFPVGIGHIVKSLQLHGFPFEVIDLIPIPYERRMDEFKHFLSSVSAPGIFGFSIIAGNDHIKEVEKYAMLVKETDPRHIIVFGGPLPSAIPKLCLTKTVADYVIVGEGEESFINFLNNFSTATFQDVPGLGYKDKDGTIRVNKKVRVQNLDRFSPIPYECFNMNFYNDYLKKTNRCFEISGSRGCKGACTFCFRFSGPGLTARSGKSLFDEVKLIYERYGIDRFNFTDENFIQKKENFYSFLSLLKHEGIHIKFRGQTRVDDINDEFCKLLVGSGLISINFGVESADNGILRKIAKGITVQDIEAKIRLMRSYGVEVYANFIIGFPWETVDSIRAIKYFILRNGLQGHCNVSYLAPLPATRLYDEAKKMNLIGDEWEYIQNLGDLFQDRKINMTSLNREDLGRFFEEILEIGGSSIPRVSREYSGALIENSIIKENL